MAQPIVGLVDEAEPVGVARAETVLAVDPPDAGPAPAPGFDPRSHYRLHPSVALRPEPFGALAYHYGSRRLTFLRSPLLAELVRGLEQHASAEAALCATVPETKRPSYRRALASLAGSGFICAA